MDGQRHECEHPAHCLATIGVCIHFCLLVFLIILTIIFLLLSTQTHSSLKQVHDLADSLNNNFGWLLNYTDEKKTT